MDTRDLDDIIERQRVITENKLTNALKGIESQQNENINLNPKPLLKIHKNDLSLSETSIPNHLKNCGENLIKY